MRYTFFHALCDPGMLLCDSIWSKSSPMRKKKGFSGAIHHLLVYHFFLCAVPFESGQTLIIKRDKINSASSYSCWWGGDNLLNHATRWRFFKEDISRSSGKGSFQFFRKTAVCNGCQKLFVYNLFMTRMRIQFRWDTLYCCCENEVTKQRYLWFDGIVSAHKGQ